jgi:hypothetical protein
VVWVTPLVNGGGGGGLPGDGGQDIQVDGTKAILFLLKVHSLGRWPWPGSVRTGCCTGAGWGREGWSSSGDGCGQVRGGGEVHCRVLHQEDTLPGCHQSSVTLLAGQTITMLREGDDCRNGEKEGGFGA